MFAARQIFFTPISGAAIEATQRERALNAEDALKAAHTESVQDRRGAGPYAVQT
ncbi:hypothetical protein ABZ815_37385 [Nonomuraea sp. NPDC047529]|uniref:hypothetical protein n=1 Tax=Nonomuraea sp. NPDC047529 TaxID=3155623 RepID=UPI0033FCC22E